MMIPSFISVRSASSRLPGKCFLSFGDGNVLEYVIDRALFNDLEAIVCTTWDPDDDRIEEICDEKKVPCFRGEPINKLKRWDDCCNFFDIKAFHSVDADDPFFDGDLIKKSYKLLLEGGWDMVAPTKSSSSGGASVGYSLTCDIVKKALALTGSDEDTEMMWYWVEKVGGLKKTVLAEPRHFQARARLTLDYEEDYWFLKSLLKMVDGEATRREINDVLSRNPDLYKINWFRNNEWANRQRSKNIKA